MVEHPFPKRKVERSKLSSPAKHRHEYGLYVTNVDEEKGVVTFGHICNICGITLPQSEHGCNKRSARPSVKPSSEE